jgi:FMN phosphatase YigB (HAD superfamily)
MLVLPVPGDLPLERSPVSDGHLGNIEVVTFDFGNTLVPVDRAGLRRVVELTAERVAQRLGPFRVDRFLETWAEERERQFREEVPQFREVDLADRFVRVLARLRGVSPPSPEDRWDQAAAVTHSTPAEIDWAVEVYSVAFVEVLPAPPRVGPLLARLAEHRVLAILSNWPLAATIDRFVEAAGWRRHLRAVVVSQRVGTIKPHPAIFAATLEALGGPRPDRVLHVGDDWAADVVGAKRAGWRAAYLDARPGDSPLPGSVRDGEVAPDLEIATLDELEPALAPLRRRPSASTASQ